MPLADATSIFFTSPIYTSWLGLLLLGEKFHWLDVVLSLGVVAGTVFVAQPTAIFGTSSSTSTTTGGGSLHSFHPLSEASAETQQSNRTVGSFAALAGAFSSAFVYIFIRKTKGADPLSLVFVMGVVGVVLVPLGALITAPVWSVPSSTWWFVAAIGVFAFFGQVLFNKGGQMESANLSSVIRNLDVVFAFFWQATVLSEHISGLSVLGAFIVLTCVVTMGLRKWKASQHTIPLHAIPPASEDPLPNSARGVVLDPVIEVDEIDDIIEVEVDHDQVSQLELIDMTTAGPR